MSKVYDDMMNGEIYWPGDEELMKQQLDCMEKLYDYNATRPHEWEKRQKLLKEMLAEAGEDCYIEPPLHANWGGHHLHLGKQVYANYNLTAVDDGEIFIGDYTMIGPNVTLATPNHPLAPELREKGYQYNLPIRIGKNVWLGAGVIVVPGVTIGDNTVIGAGSVDARHPRGCAGLWRAVPRAARARRTRLGILPQGQARAAGAPEVPQARQRDAGMTTVQLMLVTVKGS